MHIREQLPKPMRLIEALQLDIKLAQRPRESLICLQKLAGLVVVDNRGPVILERVISLFQYCVLICLGYY
jgi:hypothetical protein